MTSYPTSGGGSTLQLPIAPKAPTQVTQPILVVTVPANHQGDLQQLLADRITEQQQATITNAQILLGHHDQSVSSRPSGAMNTNLVNRKSMHNVVEKRRRNRINVLINELAELIPADDEARRKSPTNNSQQGVATGWSEEPAPAIAVCQAESFATSTNSTASKGAILERAVRYVRSLQTELYRMEHGEREEVAHLKHENTMLRQMLTEHGINMTDSVNRSMNESLNRSMNESINQSMNESLAGHGMSAPEPLSQATIERLSEHGLTGSDSLDQSTMERLTDHGMASSVESLNQSRLEHDMRSPQDMRGAPESVITENGITMSVEEG